MTEFFQVYYLTHSFGVGWIVKDVLFAAGLALLLSASGRRSAAGVALFLARMTCIWGALLLANSILYMLASSLNMIVITYPLVTALSVLAIRGLRLPTRITQAGCFYMFFIYAVHSVDLLYTLWTGSESLRPIGSATVFYEWIRCLLVFICFVLAVTYLRICTIDGYEYIDNAGVIILVIFMIIMAFLPDYAEKGTDLQNLITNIALGVLQLLAYFMFYSGTKEHARRLDAQMVLVHQSEEVRQLQLSQQNYENMQMLRHEIKNQYGYMKMMLGQKQYDKLEKFFTECSERMLDTLPVIDCGNYVINAVINMESGKASHRGVRLEHKIAVPPTLSIPDSDLSSVLTNLIDNAIEACCAGHVAAEDAAVRVSVRKQNRSLFIRVVNPLGDVSAQSALALQTKKSDAALHGYGTKIVRRLAEKYSGSVRYQAEGGMFTADVLLTLPAGAAAEEQ